MPTMAPHEQAERPAPDAQPIERPEGHASAPVVPSRRPDAVASECGVAAFWAILAGSIPASL